VSPFIARHQLDSITRVSRKPDAEAGEAGEEEDTVS
jgi:hypothetical protein